MDKSVSYFVNSSSHQAIADDSLKDEDNAAWITTLPPDVRQIWIERVGWIRLVDRLAEQDLLDNSKSEFINFRQSWDSLYQTGTIKADYSYRHILYRIQESWLKSPVSRTDLLAGLAWNKYVEAIAFYHQPNLIIDSLEDYEIMLDSLSGSFFQIFPFLEESQFNAVRAFGILDQFYNNLRDIEEDTQQGICYFPTQLLQGFGLTRQDILSYQAWVSPNYQKMMQFWLNTYEGKLRENAQKFIDFKNLHPSWQILRQWSLHRYARIYKILHSNHFNPVLFSHQYWVQVQQELGNWAARPSAVIS